MTKISVIAEQVRNEEDAFCFMQRVGIVHSFRYCSNGHMMCLCFKSRRWRCFRSGCEKEIGIRTGTWIAKSNLDFSVILQITYFWAYEKLTVKFGENNLGVGHTTECDWTSFLREICMKSLTKKQKQIGGEGLTVEIDETLIAKRKSDVGRVLFHQWVFGGVCRETGEVFVVKVPDRKAKTLIPLITKYIRPGTIIMSDMWRPYSSIKKYGYKHLRVNHKKNFVDPKTNAHTQTIERCWRSLKERSKRQCGISIELLDSYLAEFMWRARLKEKDPFEAIIHDIAHFWSWK